MAAGKVLSLKVFIRQAQTLKLFRDFLRKIRQIPDSSLRLQLQQEVKSQFRYNSHLVDSMAIKSAKIEAQRSMKQIEALITPLTQQQQIQPSSNDIHKHHNETVMNNNPVDNEDEKEYRVGSGWPWDR